MIAWHIILADSNGMPDKKVGLISNALDPAVWPGEIAEEIDVPFDWLNNPDYSDSITHVRMVQHYRDVSARSKSTASRAKTIRLQTLSSGKKSPTRSRGRWQPVRMPAPPRADINMAFGFLFRRAACGGPG